MKEAYYFSHDSNASQDPKILALRAEFGMQGYGVYWGVIEALRQQQDYRIHKDLIIGVIVNLGVDLTLAEQMLNKMLGVQLLYEQDDFVHSNSLLIRMKKREELSEKRSFAGKMSGLKRAKLKQKETSVEQNLTSVEQSPTIKEKKIKENESKIILSKDNTTKVEYGNPDINICISYLKEKIQGSLDGTQKSNRQYCYLLINRLKKDYPENVASEQICKLIDIASLDDFHSKNLTSFKYLYNNAGKIIQSVKTNSTKTVKV